MTVNLTMMLDMRDAQVAVDVARKAELGWFDVEFTMYGCVYEQHGQRCYRLSAEAEKIYDFIANGAKNDLIPTKLLTLTEKYPVPVGMREGVALEVKKALAQNMQVMYPLDFFSYLRRLRQEAADDSGYDFLLTEKQRLAWCFDEKKLKLFEDTVDFIYVCGKITREHYESLLCWLTEERKNMEEDPVPKGKFVKNFYGAVYQSGSDLKYIVNARKASVYRKIDELIRQNLFVSPIFSRTYYYSSDVRLPQVRQRFEAELKEYLDQAYLEPLKSLLTHNSRISNEQLAMYSRECAERFGEAAAETLRYYGYRWGVLGD